MLGILYPEEIVLVSSYVAEGLMSRGTGVTAISAPPIPKPLRIKYTGTVTVDCISIDYTLHYTNKYEVDSSFQF